MRVGDVFTRDEIRSLVGAGGDDYVLTKNGQVVAVTLNPKMNPKAPDVIIAGKGPRIERRAHLLLHATVAVPVFLKRAPNQWHYVGNYKCTSLHTDALTIENHRQHRDRHEVYAILFLQMG